MGQGIPGSLCGAHSGPPHFRTEQGHCGACRRKWRLTDTDLCPCGETQTISQIVESCPRQDWMAAYLGCTLQMKMLFPGWPIIVYDTHIREEEVVELVLHGHIASSSCYHCSTAGQSACVLASVKNFIQAQMWCGAITRLRCDKVGAMPGRNWNVFCKPTPLILQLGENISHSMCCY